MSMSIGVTLESDAWITCHDYGTTRTPILAVHSTTGGLTLHTAPDAPAREQVEIARQFANAAAQMLALTEKWAAARTVSLVKDR
ncbi:hypothetical protein [Streptacidiphilus cavernicola]|uniref:DUF1876 domain-containing protein n=1 Tax=Streptacidiphilus cavernicola TaxID=3342716 RepID=A0ABV6VRY2_9ACTN